MLVKLLAHMANGQPFDLEGSGKFWDGLFIFSTRSVRNVITMNTKQRIFFQPQKKKKNWGRSEGLVGRGALSEDFSCVTLFLQTTRGGDIHVHVLYNIAFLSKCIVIASETIMIEGGMEAPPPIFVIIKLCHFRQYY